MNRTRKQRGTTTRVAACTVFLLSHCFFFLIVMARAAHADARLVDAAKHQDKAAVRALVQQRADVNIALADGATALHWAAHWNDLEIAEALLGGGANPNALNDLGVAPLSLACTNASAAMVERLLKAGADPNLKGTRVPALLTCARTGSLEAVRALLARKADVNAREPMRDQTALMWAVASGQAEVARELLKHGANVHARARVTRALVNRANPNDINAAVVGEVSQGGSTPLLFVARAGSVPAAEALAGAGANVNDIAPDGTSALTMAVHSGHTALAKFLLARGANPNIIGSGYTALHAAVLRGSLEMVDLLLGNGALLNSRLRHGTATKRGSREFFLPESLTGATPVLLAARFLELEIMQTLLTRGADPSATLQDGSTMLMLAAGSGAQTKLFDRRDRIAVLKESDQPRALAAVRLALERGATVNVANQAGETALHAAARMNYPQVAATLITAGARVDALNRKGETPLAVASGDEVKKVLTAK